jgi:hypothetical protein
MDFFFSKIIPKFPEKSTVKILKNMGIFSWETVPNSNHAPGDPGFHLRPFPSGWGFRHNSGNSQDFSYFSIPRKLTFHPVTAIMYV